MAVTAIVGTQWGDEGKGRITDLLATTANAVIRYQGGANAGHTVINNQGKFALHLLPSGIFNASAMNILGPGVIVDPQAFLQEFEDLKKKARSIGRIFISDRAHVSLPFHRQIETLLDQQSSSLKYGSTKRGIAQAYEFKVAKVGLQMGDLLNDEHYLHERLKPIIGFANTILKGLDQPAQSVEATIDYLRPLLPHIRPFIVNIFPVLQELLKNNKEVLLEGQLGTLRDLDWGIYPYTTSSNPIAGYACVGGGIPPGKINHILGIMKAYSTCVGSGPFVSEIQGEIADKIREVGKEYGASTGRPRRIGWFDVVASKYGAHIQGVTSLSVTLLDVLSCLENIQVCTHYMINGEKTSDFPAYYRLKDAKPVFESFPGWQTPIEHIRKFEDLPAEARSYVEFIRDTIELPISYISVGPRREEIIYLDR